MELNALVELLAEDLPANETYSRTIDALGHLLSELSPADWGAPTIEGWTVKGLVAHVVAVEEYFSRQLGLWAVEIDGRLAARRCCPTPPVSDG